MFRSVKLAGRFPGSSRIASIVLAVTIAILFQLAVALPFACAQQPTEAVLHNFGAAGDGYNPDGGLIQASDGSLYGTTSVGGAYGYGTLFKFTTSGAETVLHSFSNANGDGGSER